MDMTYSCSCNPLILSPTCITDKIETLIDNNIFTNDSYNISGILMFDTNDNLFLFSL